jgi:hypothetical protein
MRSVLGDSTCYNRLVRLRETDVPVQGELELRVLSTTSITSALWRTAGTAKKNVVLLGSHLQSCHGGAGATDSAAGVAALRGDAHLVDIRSLDGPTLTVPL